MIRRKVLILITLLAASSAIPAQAATPVVVGASGNVSSLSRAVPEPLAVHSFSDLNAHRPQATKLTNIQAGSISYGTVASAPVGSAVYQMMVRWADVVKARRAPTWVTFSHEADCGCSHQHGTSAQYVQAFRRIHNVFAAHQASNAIWVNVLMAYTYRSRSGHPERWWPGNDVVDVVGADGYNWTGSQAAAGIFRSALTYAGAHHKPLLIAEFGTAPKGRADWLRQTAAWISANRNRIAGAFYYNNAEWTLTSAKDRAAFSQLVRLV
jgi:Glycosyl hydrolase family 26